MKTLHFMVLRAFLPVFILAIVFFVLILELVDIFTNLVRYLSRDVPFAEIARVAILYVPKCVAFSVPIGLLFAVAYTLGNMYANNELIAVFGAGVSLALLATPLFLFGLFISFGGFLFQEYVVIDTFIMKNELEDTLLKQRSSLSNANVTVLSNQNRIVYHAAYYNDNTKTLSDVIILEKDEYGEFSKRIDAEWAEWKENLWILHECRVFSWTEDESHIQEIKQTTYSNERLTEHPNTFRKIFRDIEEMKIDEAKEWIASLRKAGLPYKEQLTEYYSRFSFSLTPLIVAVISSGIGGRFKKNILLMSLLSSLIIVVVYYVLQMVAGIFSTMGLITPVAGAWSPFFIFFLIGIGLFKVART